MAEKRQRRNVPEDYDPFGEVFSGKTPKMTPEQMWLKLWDVLIKSYFFNRPINPATTATSPFSCCGVRCYTA